MDKESSRKWKHAHDPRNAHGWDWDYLQKHGDVVCDCGHPLKFHNHDGGRIPCATCGCQFFTNPASRIGRARAKEIPDASR
jgi:hypothetical protein